MAIINILPNGSTSGNPNPMGNKNPSKRKDTIGWNYQVSARLRKWLYSIPINSLSGHGYAFTLTVKNCPTTSDDWATIRNNFIKRMFRQNCLRLQWLTEWQQRGVPHLHGIAYFEDEIRTDYIKNTWSSLAVKYGSQPWAQDCKPVHDVTGWLNYLSKHASRSATHYQRSSDNIPEGWKKTGRMWGYRGDWDLRQPMKFEIDQEGFYRYRRIAKSIYKSNVRHRFNAALAALSAASTSDQITKLKSLHREYSISKKVLQTNSKDMGRMMGTSDWIDQEDAIKIITFLGSQGHQIQQAD